MTHRNIVNSQYFLPACGLLTLVAAALQPNTLARCFQMVFFLGLSKVSGKRVRLLPPLLLLTGVVLANLLVPNGRVLFSFGRLNITTGSLDMGISKGALLIGLIYISRISIARGVRLPGVFGGLLFRAFSYFEALTEGFYAETGRERRPKVQLRGLMIRLDTLLLELDSAGGAGDTPNTPGPVNPDRRKVLTGIALLAVGWIPYAVILLLP